MTTKRKRKTKKAISRKARRAAKRPRRLFALDAKITIKASANPHRAGTYDAAKFRKLRNGMTVKEALSKVDAGYLRYGVKRELFAIG